MKIYVINLDRRPDRLTQIRSQLGAQGLTFERVPAIDGGPDTDIGYPPDHPRLQKTEYACYLSHVACWQRLVDSGEDYALILEDDAMLSASLHDLLSRTELFDHPNGITRLETLGLISSVHKKPVRTSGPYTLYDSITYLGGSAAYVISRAKAEDCLKHHSAPAVPLDDLLYWEDRDILGRPSIMQLVPGVAIQHMHFNRDNPDIEKDSDIASERSVREEDIATQKGLLPTVRKTTYSLYWKIVKRIGCVKVLVEFDP